MLLFAGIREKFTFTVRTGCWHIRSSISNFILRRMKKSKSTNNLFESALFIFCSLISEKRCCVDRNLWMIIIDRRGEVIVLKIDWIQQRFKNLQLCLSITRCDYTRRSLTRRRFDRIKKLSLDSFTKGMSKDHACHVSDPSQAYKT